MDKRTVVVFDAQNSTKDSYETAATTFGELKSEIGRSFEGKKVTVMKTKVTLENDDAVLPEGNTVLALFQKQSKFGSDLTVPESEELFRISEKLDKIIKLLKPLKRLSKLLKDVEELDKLSEEARKIQEKMK